MWWWKNINIPFQIPNTKVTQKRFKSRKKKTDQVLDQASLEPTEENEIIPDTSETDSTRNDLVTADFNEEISVKEIEQEEVEVRKLHIFWKNTDELEIRLPISKN